MDNLILNLCAFASWREIVFSLVAVLIFAVSRPSAAKYVLVLCGSFLLSSCLSLRLGKNEPPEQAAARTEMGYIDREAAARR
jgi:hypothetical protein